MPNNTTTPNSTSTITWGKMAAASLGFATAFQPSAATFGPDMKEFHQTPPPTITGLDILPLIDAKIGMSEAKLGERLAVAEGQTDTKFAQLFGKIDVLMEKVGSLDTNMGSISSTLERVESKADNSKIVMISSAIAVVAVLYGVIGYGHQIADTVTSAYSSGITAGQGTQNAKPNAQPSPQGK
jgi:hypothetical protein